MNKTVVIIGSVVVLGVGAYFYFKPKKTGATGTGNSGTGTSGTDTTGTGTTGTGTTSVPPTDTTLSTPAQVEDLLKKTAEATSIAKQIYDLKQAIDNAKYKNSISNSSDWTANITKARNEAIIKSSTKSIPTLIQKLSDLGYTESYGVAIKK
jgi:hypothetical protein